MGPPPLRPDARTPGLARLVPSHGATVGDGAAEVLADVARRLRG